MRFPKGRIWAFLNFLALICAVGSSQARSPSSAVQYESKSTSAGDKTATIPPEKNKTNVEGVVTNAFGEAVTGAAVTVRDSQGESRTVVTDSQGAFRFAGMKPENKPFSLVQTNIEGVVSDASGEGVAGAAVTVKDPQGNSRTVVTDSQGRFRTGRVNLTREVKREYRPNAFVRVVRPVTPVETSHRVKFWALQGLMFASIPVAVETTHNCLNAGSCTLIPNPVQSRPAMYSLGIPVAAGISVLSYESKKRGNHWWYLPPAIIVGAGTALSIHSARASQ